MNKKNENSIKEKSQSIPTEESEVANDEKKRGPSEALFTIKDVADYWKCSPCSVYDALRLGRLRAFKVGNSWRIPFEALKDYEAERSKTCQYCQQTELQKMLNDSKGKCIMKIQ